MSKDKQIAAAVEEWRAEEGTLWKGAGYKRGWTIGLQSYAEEIADAHNSSIATLRAEIEDLRADILL